MNMPTLEDAVKELGKKIKKNIRTKWAVGYRDRGMGHGDYCVMVERTKEVLFGQIDQEYADHIVNLHNESLRK